MANLSMKISELSRATGVSPRMLRYFEGHGVIKPEREENGYRLYNPDQKDLVLSILEWQRLGFALKEIRELLNNSEAITQIVDQVFTREREKFLEKEKALQDLREKMTGQKHPYFPQRVAYKLKGLSEIFDDLESRGFPAQSCDYIRYSEWRELASSDDFSCIGEMISQSTYYILSARNLQTLPSPVVSACRDFTSPAVKLAAEFFKVANKYWPLCDGHPPVKVDKEDLFEFLAASEIVVSIKFHDYNLVLPYQALFPLANG